MMDRPLAELKPLDRAREEMMRGRDIFDGIPFSKLAYALGHGRRLDRSQDRVDVELMEECLVQG